MTEENKCKYDPDQVVQANDSFWLREFKQLHIYLIRYRVLAIIVTFFCCWLVLDAWLFWKQHYKEFKDFDATAGIAPFILAFLGGVKWSLDNVSKRHEGIGE